MHDEDVNLERRPQLKFLEHVATGQPWEGSCLHGGQLGNGSEHAATVLGLGMKMGTGLSTFPATYMASSLHAATSLQASGGV